MTRQVSFEPESRLEAALWLAMLLGFWGGLIVYENGKRVFNFVRRRRP